MIMNELFQLGILGGGESGVAAALLGKKKKINDAIEAPIPK